MNNVDSVALVEGAIGQLASAVNAGSFARADVRGATPLASALETALRRLLLYYDCVPDDVAISQAIRAERRADIVQGICERHGLLVRQVSFNGSEMSGLWGPVLAFHGDVPVLLLPGTWKRWTAILPSQSAPAPRLEDLEPQAFAFYRGVGDSAMSLPGIARRLLGRDNRRDLFYAAAWGVGAALLSACSVYLLQALVDWALPEGDRTSLELLAAGWCAVALTVSNLRLSRVLLQSRVGTRLDVTMEAALVGRTLSLPLRVFKTMAAGDLGERIRGASNVAKAAIGSATDVILACVMVAAYVAMLATTSLHAAVTVLAIVLARALVGGLLLSRVYVEGRTQATTRGKMSGQLFEMLTGIARIKVACAQTRAFCRWAAGFADVRRASYKGSLYGGALVASEAMFDVLGTVVLYLTCTTQSPGEPALGVGAFVVASASLAGLQTAYSDVMRGLQQVLPLVPDAERVRPILTESAEVSGSAASTRLEGDVSLRNVTFHYAEDDVRILDHVSLDIKNGEFVAIVGPSGCGKSTLIKLILGFYPPTSGSVLLDGKDLAKLDLRSVRSQVGAVLQGSELLPSSILFNIVGTSGKTQEDAWTAARRACVAADIERLPMKMHTLLSDRAVTISGGQKQRILIARALVREPRLIIFDEATSALDNTTQAGVMRALEEMPCTKIFIAHRLSTIVKADRIIVMDKGAIVQQGTFDELMREEGIFRSMAMRQVQTSARDAEQPTVS